MTTYHHRAFTHQFVQISWWQCWGLLIISVHSHTILCRSPGGTPLQTRPKPSSTDPASIIAEALRKKFRNRVQHSPDQADKENENPDFDSPENNTQFKVSHAGVAVCMSVYKNDF